MSQKRRQQLKNQVLGLDNKSFIDDMKGIIVTVALLLVKEFIEKMPSKSVGPTSTFLNGLIIEKRGKKEGSEVINETKVNNNIIFNKLKIAFNLKAETIIEILKLVEFTFSKHELSALFIKPDHKHYRECKDQVLRNFLGGLQIKMREN